MLSERARISTKIPLSSSLILSYSSLHFHEPRAILRSNLSALFQSARSKLSISIPLHASALRARLTANRASPEVCASSRTAHRVCLSGHTAEQRPKTHSRRSCMPEGATRGTSHDSARARHSRARIRACDRILARAANADSRSRILPSAYRSLRESPSVILPCERPMRPPCVCAKRSHRI